MTDESSSTNKKNLLTALDPRLAGHHQVVSAQPLSPAMALLKGWQAQRLAETHADLLRQPRYQAAGRFLRSDIYAPRDFSQRNADMRKFHHLLSAVLPASLVQPLTLTLELYALTEVLDEQLLHILATELAMTDSLSAEQYAAAYRLADNYAERVRQIELMVQIGQGLDSLTGLPWVGLTLKLARRPAQQAGWQDLQDFLERGLAAFKQLRGAKAFLETIQRRELQILAQIYAQANDPFQVDR